MGKHGSHRVAKGHSGGYGCCPYRSLFIFKAHFHFIGVNVYVHIPEINGNIQHIERELAPHKTSIKGTLYPI